MIDLLDNEAIFEKLEKLRIERGWTHYELAKQAKISPNAIYNWRDRKSSPTLYTLASVCIAFNISPITFLNGDEEYNELTEDQKTLLQSWSSLTKEQRKSIISLIKSMKRNYDA